MHDTTDSRKKTINVADLGAKDNGVDDCKEALHEAWQKAKDHSDSVEIQFRKSQGGRGIFLLHPLVLKGGNSNNIQISIGDNVTLLVWGYTDDGYDKWTEHDLKAIQFEDVENISIVGADPNTSILHGNGLTWPGFIGEKRSITRPRLLQFTKCKKVQVRNFTIVNSPSFNLVFQGCDGGEVNNVTISCPIESHNTDGIHLNASKHFNLANITICNGDDAIVVAAGAKQISKDHTIQNIRVFGSHGISIGSTLEGTVKDVTVSDVHMAGSANGIRIKTKANEHGEVASCTYTNFVLTDVGVALAIENGNYEEVGSPEARDDKDGLIGAHLRDITVTGVTVNGCEYVGQIYTGKMNGDQIRNFKIENFTATSYENAWAITGDTPGFTTSNVTPAFQPSDKSA